MKVRSKTLNLKAKSDLTKEKYDIDFDGLSIGYLAGYRFVAPANRH
jgi:hypothetical protein